MKKIIILIILILSASLYAEFEFVKNDVSNLAERDCYELRLPGLNFDVDVTNSLLAWENWEIFDTSKYEDGSVMSDADKQIFTDGDLDIVASFKTEIFGFGYKNWDFSLEGIVQADVEILDKKYSKLVFYGNELDVDYVVHSGENSLAFSFIKSSLRYAHPDIVNIGMIHPIIDNYLLSSKVGTYINEMPVYLGANINLNYSTAYAKVLDSDQYFGAMADSLYYNYRVKVGYTDNNSSGSISTGIGFGAKIGLIENGWMQFRMDDIFTKLTYNNLAGAVFEGSFIDSLLYLEEDNYESFTESVENDSIRYGRKSFYLQPTVSLGFEYSPFENFTVETKYENCDYSLKNGFSFAVGYLAYEFLPLKIIVGSGKNGGFSEWQSGLNYKNIDYDFALSFNDGMINSAKGIGFRTALKIKF